jgi:histidyl-tRNA synthetase
MGERGHYRTIKGTRDILPPDSELWNRVEQTARETFSTYGFGEIRTPILEQTELFSRSIGDDTDVVGKEMYTFTDQGEDRVSLRPEGTASVVRAYIQHGMHVWPQPVRLYYAGPMFRRERPQKGRYRQFYQIGAEVLGQSDESLVDADVLEMLARFFNRLGLIDTVLEINSIGDKRCRPQYLTALREQLFTAEVQSKLGPDSLRRIQTNPLRILDSKSPEEQEVIESLPRISDFWCDDCGNQFERLKNELLRRGVLFKENWRLVRGLDYYEKTTFEITAPRLGSQNAVCGGGRYDGLSEILGGPPTPGFGFAIGTDRLILTLQEQQDSRHPASDISRTVVLQRFDALVVPYSEVAWDDATSLARRLRERGLAVYLPKRGTKLPRAFESAKKMEVPVVFIVGQDASTEERYHVRVMKYVSPQDPDTPPLEGADKVVTFGRAVKLRQDLESVLRRLVPNQADDDRAPAFLRLLNELKGVGRIDERFFEHASDVYRKLNKIIHGQNDISDGAFVTFGIATLVLTELHQLEPIEGNHGA